MKIAFMVEMGTAVGGGGYALYRFAEDLAKRGHEVKVFGLSSDNKILEGRELPNTLSISDRAHFKKKFKGAGRIDALLDFIYSMFVIKRFAKKNRYDFICGQLRTAAIYASEIAKKDKHLRSVNFVYETPPWMENDLKDRWHSDFRGRFKRSWIRTKRAYMESDILISNSKLSQDWCERWLGKKKVDGFVYPGIDLENLDLMGEEKETDSIVYVGRLNAYKNIDHIIYALSKLDSPPKLIVLGHGKEREHLEKLAVSLGVRVDFKGKVSDEDKWKYIKRSKFMVFPSGHEGFGMPPMEALACRKPCICSDKAIFKEVYGKYVDYFKSGDVDDLKDKIKELASNKSLRESKGEKGRAFVEKTFSWKKSAEKIEGILESAR